MSSNNSEAWILDHVIHDAEETIATGKSFLAVFDLDSTLFDLTQRVTAIIRQFIIDECHRFPVECARLEALVILPTDWGIAEGLARIGLSGSAYPKFFSAIHDYWSEHFFSGNYLHHDEPLPGAVDFVRHLETVGADIIYLTGRYSSQMYEGTKKSLIASGFPVNKSNLMLKPDANLDDARFKAEALRDYERTYDQVWLFENEPVNTNLIGRECPTIKMVFLDTTHSGRETACPTLHVIKHFDLWTRKPKS